ncbi:methyltransferase [Longimycelium tulufanense]|uniref:Methyltransferase n=1 Tax=Longimycelium tulufanense TaxID=907463 RepID=A0A8J3C999_9PSEU|nr:class I SAM-dependent methyltransferase [Longimycelium tulufanense]GGM59816.1 methyltransferase [Longimycelium tulufanense]
MPFDHNDHYHRLLLRQVPSRARRALDVGCGVGLFARKLAARGLEVDAIDSSAEVIQAGKRLSAHCVSVRFRCAEVTTVALPKAGYDYISCLASIHHVPFDTVTRLRDALAPGGVLVILGCYRESTPVDHLISLPAAAINLVARGVVALREELSRQDAAVMQAPVCRPTMALPEIKQQAANLLPSCTITRLLFWRYFLTYRQAM